MNDKRFYMDNSGDLYDRETNSLIVIDFGYSYNGVECKKIIDLLNEQSEKISSLEEELNKCYNAKESINYKQEIEGTLQKHYEFTKGRAIRYGENQRIKKIAEELGIELYD